MTINKDIIPLGAIKCRVLVMMELGSEVYVLGRS